MVWTKAYSQRKNLVEVLVGGALLAFIVMTFTGYFIFRYVIQCSKNKMFLESFIFYNKTQVLTKRGYC